MGPVLIIGAKSDIAQALARVYAQHGHDLILAGRGIEQLEPFAKDLTIRYQGRVELLEFDVLAMERHASIYDGLDVKPGGLICAAGYLGDQARAETDFTEARLIIDTNFTGLASILGIVAADFAQRKQGFIIGISSVAGDRGRKSNYIYGSAKAALTAYLSGLRNRLHDAGVQVLTVKPGFVNTRMTQGMDLPPRLTSQPKEVAHAIYKAQQRGASVLYTSWHWRWIMLIIRHIPEFMFKRMSI